jgi:hypothetical protein
MVQRLAVEAKHTDAKSTAFKPQANSSSGSMSDDVYVPRMLKSTEQMKLWIRLSLNHLDEAMLRRICTELDCF